MSLTIALINSLLLLALNINFTHAIPHSLPNNHTLHSRDEIWLPVWARTITAVAVAIACLMIFLIGSSFLCARESQKNHKFREIEYFDPVTGAQTSIYDPVTGTKCKKGRSRQGLTVSEVGHECTGTVDVSMPSSAILTGREIEDGVDGNVDAELPAYSPRSSPDDEELRRQLSLISRSDFITPYQVEPLQRARLSSGRSCMERGSFC